MNILIPKNLELDRIIKVRPPNFNFQKEIFYCLIYYIIRFSFSKNDKENLFVSLCAKKLRDNVHHDYNKYLNYMKEVVLIKKIGYVKESRNKQGECAKYRLIDELLFDELVPYIVKRYTTARRMKEQNPKKATIKKYSHLYQFFNDGKLTLDGEAARYELDSNYSALVEKTLEDARRYQFGMISINHFEEGYWWFKNNPNTDNRLHTNITNMSKVVRKYLRYDGERLIGIDIKSSQPLILLVLLKSLVKISKGETLNSNIERIIKKVIPHRTLNTLIMLAKTLETLYNQEFKRYEDWVLSNDIYEMLGQEYHKLNSTDLPPYTYWEYDESAGYPRKKIIYDTREYMKLQMFQIFFSKPKGITTFKNLFADVFPTISHLVDTLKMKDHKKLSKVLQHIEAFIVLECVTKQISEQHGVVQFTIHDSIYTTPKNVILVKAEFENRFREHTGFIPKLSIEDNCKDCNNNVTAA